MDVLKNFIDSIRFWLALLLSSFVHSFSPSMSVEREIDSKTSNWGEIVKITSPIRKSHNTKDVENFLQNKKYSKVDDANYNRVVFMVKISELNGYILYDKSVSEMPCKMHYVVGVKPLNNSTIIDAIGFVEENGCL